MVKARIKDEKSKMQKDMNENIHKEVESYILRLPQKGLNRVSFKHLIHINWIERNTFI